MQVLVVGGGLSGLFLSNLLLRRGVRVRVIEEDPHIGKPQHCAGVVSPNAIRILGNILGNRELKREVIVNRIRSLTISISTLFKGEYHNTKEVYIINRERLENILASKIIADGGELVLGRRLSLVRSGGNTVKIDSTDIDEIEKKYDYIVIAVGALGALLRKGIKKIFPSYQVDIKDTTMDEENIEVFVDKDLNPYFFMWSIPLGNGTVRVGTAGRNPHKIVNHHLKRHYGDNSYKYKITNKYFGHIVLTGPVTPFYSGKYIYIGDTAGQTKVTTGGGIYYLLMAANFLAHCIISGDINNYQLMWLSNFKEELILQKLLRRLFLLLNNQQIYSLVLSLQKHRLIDGFLSYGDVDRHGQSFIRYLVNKFMPKFLSKHREVD